MEKIRSESSRISEAYLLMASGAKYRPAAPCDVFDNVTMTGREIKDPNQFKKLRNIQAVSSKKISLHFK